MADTHVLPVSVTEQRRAAKKKKRARPPEHNPEKEEETRQKNMKRVSVLGAEDGSVKLLEELVFGAEDELLERLVEVMRSNRPKLERPAGFMRSAGGSPDCSQVEEVDEEVERTASLLVEEDEQSGESDDEAGRQRQASRRPAWVDEDDEQEEEVDMKHRYRKHLVRGDTEVTMTKLKLQQRMREQFQKAMGGAPSWAESGAKKKKKKKKATADEEDDDDDDDDEEDDLLRRTGNFVGSSDSLPSGVLRMKKCPHANSARPSEERLTTVQFHPSAQVVMTAGLDQSVSLFQVDGRTNPKIQSLHLERFPVHKARFSVGGDSVIATSVSNKMFYLYDMMEGRVTPVHCIRGLNEARVKEFSVCPEGGALLLTGTRGYLHLLTLKTKEVVRSMKINGDISGVAFTHDGSKVFVNSEEGEVYVWDMRSSRCVNRFTDDGCVKATSIAASPNGQYLACGSQSGVVNIYSQEACLTSANPKPLKAVMNLLTSATSLTFNPTSEILAAASQVEDEAVRLVHLPSLSVFSNFPVSNRKFLYRASCLDFSPHSGFFALANNKGHAPLFRLLHYKDF